MAILADGVFEAGSQQFRFDADGLAPGLYAVQATTNSGAALRTMLVLGSR
ncbi:MAG: hypothetical protein IPP94_09970 [Ignavibacteria bacterium]|nr:hypothetical protein [Ignavibacteria bacterium]